MWETTGIHKPQSQKTSQTDHMEDSLDQLNAIMSHAM